MGKYRSRVALILAVSVALIAGCGDNGQNAAPAELSESDKQAAAAAAREAEIKARTAQIQNSNLPPDQKQQLLRQMNSAAGKR